MNRAQLESAFFARGPRIEAFRAYVYDAAAFEGARGVLDAALAQERIATEAFLGIAAATAPFDGAFDYSLAYPGLLQARLRYLDTVDAAALDEADRLALENELGTLRNLLASEEARMLGEARVAVSHGRENLAIKAQRVDCARLADFSASASAPGLPAAFDEARLGGRVSRTLRLGFSPEEPASSPFALLLKENAPGENGRSGRLTETGLRRLAVLPD